MQPVVRVAESREREAARVLGAAEQEVVAHRTRLQELQEYRVEYRNQLVSVGNGGIAAQRYVEYHRFLARLDLAIEHQERLLEMTVRQREEKRALWAEARAKMKAVEKVVERFVTEEEAERLRREQKETDERAQRHALRY